MSDLKCKRIQLVSACIGLVATWFAPSIYGANVTNELNASYYEGVWSKMPDFDTLTPVSSGTTAGFDISGAAVADGFGYRFDGFILIEVGGRYDFFLKSDDGSKLYVDGEIVVINDALNNTSEVKASLLLDEGFHEIRVDYFHKNGSELLEVRYAHASSVTKQQIPIAKLASSVDSTVTGHWFSDSRYGMFIHWGPYVEHGGDITISWSRTTQVPAAEYDQLFSTFNPTNFDANALAQCAVDTGMKYVAIVGKHHDGFSMWDTAYSSYNIMNAPIGRDLLGELATACHAKGLRFEVYYSVADWYQPSFHDDLRNPSGVADETVYYEYIKNQCSELVTNYNVDGIWYDWDMGGEPWNSTLGVALNEHLRSLKPNLILNNRAEGSTKSYQTVESQVGAFDRFLPWETVVTMSANWSWHDVRTLIPFSTLLPELIASASGNGNYMLNVTPNPLGTIDADELAILGEFGNWMTLYGDSIYGTRGGPFKPKDSFSSTCKGDRIYLFLTAPVAGGELHLPSIPNTVLSVNARMGGTTSFTQDVNGITVQLPDWPVGEPAMLVEMQIDGLATAIDPINVSDHSLSQGAEATASSTWYNLADYLPSQAVDGDESTRWSAAAGDTNGWFEVDLASSFSISQVYIKEFSSRITAFELQVRSSTNDSWTLVHTGTVIGEDPGLTINFEPVTARYVHLNILGATATPSIYEFRVFEDLSSQIQWTTDLLTCTNQVSNTGTLIEALNLGTSASSVSINGVDFIYGKGSVDSSNFETVANLETTDISMYQGNIADFDTLLDPTSWRSETTSYTNTLTGLTVGKEYLVQLFVADDRPSSVGRTLTVDGVKAGIYGGSPLVVSGIFTAMEPSVDFSMQISLPDGSVEGGQHLNAIQLREIDSSLPTTAFETWQVNNWGSYAVPDAMQDADPDEDGLINLFEYLIETSPLTAHGAQGIQEGSTNREFTITLDPEMDMSRVMLQFSFDQVRWYDVTVASFHDLESIQTASDWTVRDLSGTTRAVSLRMRTFTLADAQRAPVANDDAYEMAANTIFTNTAPGILFNDTDASGDTLRAILVAAPENGTLLSFLSDGSFRYQPNTDYAGEDTFLYETVDAGGQTGNVATVTLSIATPSVAITNIVQFGDSDLTLNVDWKEYGFTDNTSTINVGTITQDGIDFTITATSSANLSMGADGDLWGVFGGDNNDRLDDNGQLGGEWVTFSLSVSGTNVGRLTSLSLLQLDLKYFGNHLEQALVYDSTSGVTNTLTGGYAATVTDYDTELSGLTELSLTNIATWDITVEALAALTDGNTDFGFSEIQFKYTLGSGPQAPVAHADAYNVAINSIFTNAAPGVLANDTDGNNDTLTSIQLTAPTNGTLLSFASDGSFIYQPNVDFVGTDSFSYEANDGTTNSAPATVTLTVETNAPPAAPTGLSVSLGNGTVILNWFDNTEGDLASYNVRRSTVSGSYGTVLTNVVGSAFTDVSVATNITYFYVVTALDDAAQESATSTEVSATPVYSNIEELIMNGDFSEGIAYSDLTPNFDTPYWSRTIDKTAPWLTSDEFDNIGAENQALVYKTGTSSRGIVFQGISVEGGSSYTCSMRSKTLKFIAERPAWVGLDWYTSDQTLIQTDEVVSFVPDVAWVSTTNQIVAPSNAAYAVVNVGIGGHWSLTKIYMDDISVTGVRGAYNFPAVFPQYPLPFDLPVTLSDQEQLSVSLNDFIENKETNDVITYTQLEGPAWLTLSSNGDLQGEVLDPNDVGSFTNVVEVYDGSTTITQDVVVTVSAQLRLNNIFNHNMVLQREEPITFRGYSYPDSEFQLQIGDGPKLSTQTTSNGTWELTYPALSASSVPTTINLYANGFLVAYTNILVGDIWLGSGQSNMEYDSRGLLEGVLSAEEFAALFASATNQPNLRLLTIPRTEDAVPWDDLDVRADWKNCTTNSAADFSSVAYFFGKHLMDVNIPIAIINSSKGGSPIETWSNELSTGMNRYNTKINPLTKMPIKGVVWYQGEANIGASRHYGRLLRTLVADWREKWQLPLPFYIVQLAPYPYSTKGMNTYTLPEMWEQQDLTSRELEHSGLVVTHDTVELLEDGTYPENIHPPFKETVGERIALWAKHDVYGQTDLVHSGPVPREVVQEGTQLRIYFNNVTTNGLASSNGEPLTWFEVSGKDHLYVPATSVTLDGETLVVSASSITNPASVRFGWNEMAVLNFINAEGLPASAFRMDVAAPEAFKRECLQNRTFEPGPNNSVSVFDVPSWERIIKSAVNSWVTDGTTDPAIGAGNYAAKFVRVNNTIVQTFDATEGRTYDFSVEAMLSATQTVAFLKAVWLYDDGNSESTVVILDQSDGFLNSPAPGEWFTLSGTLAAPNVASNLVAGQIILETGLTGSGAPPIYFDNASVKEYLLDISYTNWLQNTGQFFAPLDDSDGDGVTSIEEYAFNLDPLVADWQIVEPGMGTLGIPFIDLSGTDGSGQLRVEYLRRKGASDLQYKVQVSTNLVDWMELSEPPFVSVIDGEWERVIEVDPVLTSDADTARFIRIQVQLD